MRMIRSSWFAAVAAAAGCGGGPDPVEVDAVVVDVDARAIDAAGDVDAAPAQGLLAVWRALPSTEDDEPEPAFLQFVAGGTGVATNSAGSTLPFQWSTDAALLTLTLGGDTETAQHAFSADGALLLLRAALPQGTPDGVVGTWVGHFNSGGHERTRTLMVATGGTGHRTEVVDGGAPTEYDFTWEQPAADELLMTSDLGGGTQLVSHARVIPGVAIGGALYAREP
jgi:hypothetical protein